MQDGLVHETIIICTYYETIIYLHVQGGISGDVYIFMENVRSWVALCLMDIFILELVSNQLTVPVKIDGRQQQEETSALLKTAPVRIDGR